MYTVITRIAHQVIMVTLVHNSSILQLNLMLFFLLMFWALTGNNQSCICQSRRFLSKFLHSLEVQLLV